MALTAQQINEVFASFGDMPKANEANMPLALCRSRARSYAA